MTRLAKCVVVNVLALVLVLSISVPSAALVYYGVTTKTPWTSIYASDTATAAWGLVNTGDGWYSQDTNSVLTPYLWKGTNRYHVQMDPNIAQNANYVCFVNKGDVKINTII